MKMFPFHGGAVKIDVNIKITLIYSIIISLLMTLCLLVTCFVLTDSLPEEVTENRWRAFSSWWGLLGHGEASQSTVRSYGPRCHLIVLQSMVSSNGPGGDFMVQGVFLWARVCS